jgi:hypothetical protein
MEGMPQRAEGLRRGGRESGVERLFGVGARFPLIADRQLACDLRTLSNAPTLPSPASGEGKGRTPAPSVRD